MLEANLLNQRRALTDLQARWTDGRIKLIHALGSGFTERTPEQRTATPQ